MSDEQNYAEVSATIETPAKPADAVDAVKGIGIFVTIMVLVVLGWGIARGVGSKTPEYKPTDVQMLRLQLKQSQAQTKRLQLNQATAEFNTAYAALMDEANAVKKENKWPMETLVDPDKLVFSAPPAPLPGASAPPKATAPPAPAAAKK